MSRKTVARLPRLAPLTRVRLWFRFQRYAFLLVGVPVAGVTLAMVFTPWWLALLVGLAGIAPLRFGLDVFGRYPRKVRATRIALARIETGTFTPASIKSYCGDPCFRLVADEILASAGTARAERRRIIGSYREQLRKEESVLVIVDHVRGTVMTFGGDARERT